MFSLFLVSKPLKYIAALIFCEFANILNGKKVAGLGFLQSCNECK